MIWLLLGNRTIDGWLGHFQAPLRSTFVIRHPGLTLASGARTGAVTLIQRFGSALNLNVHLHMLFLDGAYTFHGRGRRQPEDRFWPGPVVPSIEI